MANLCSPVRIPALTSRDPGRKFSAISWQYLSARSLCSNRLTSGIGLLSLECVFFFLFLSLLCYSSDLSWTEMICGVQRETGGLVVHMSTNVIIGI